MSIGTSTLQNHAIDRELTDVQRIRTSHFSEVLQSVQDAVAPVWPLRDYVAVNPYGGFSQQTLLATRQYLQSISDCETLMPLSYYKNLFQQDKFGLVELETAIDEMVEDQIPGAESLCANAIYKTLGSEDSSFDAAHENGGVVPNRRMRSTSETFDCFSRTSWTETIHEEISKYCAAHYDEGQASWSSPWKHLPLYQAWRLAAQRDRTIEILGLSRFREFVRRLPHTADAAIMVLLQEAGVPECLWKDYLLCLSLSLPGWSAWTKFKTTEAQKKGIQRADFAGLLAIRLAYDVALSERFGFRVNLTFGLESAQQAESDRSSADALIRFTLLRANEIGVRNRMLKGMHGKPLVDIVDVESNTTVSRDRKLAQMVFCIDVRSERLRRHLEATSDEIETFGFAGFFGLPFEYVRLGDASGTNQLPVLVDPQFKVYEEIRSEQQGDSEQAKQRRARIRTLRSAWKRLQTSTVSCFTFVETMGFLYGGKLVARLFGKSASDAQFDGVLKADRDRLGPSFRNLHRQGISTTRQVDLAESMLRNLGLVDNFARLVVFCGHASQTENNPLQAGLDCGACAGHSGEANARFAAMLLHQQHVRRALAKRGIEIPADVHFLAGLHNTTTDTIEFFDVDLVPETHRGELAELALRSTVAGQLSRSERLKLLPGKDEASLLRRSEDWSEVRPEWGLAGNAAFIVGPRSLTKSLDLRGASFLHSYDFRSDTDSKVLEQIMTAPMVVANWINMQYYASTVDQRHFGSGNKTIHNVVGKFGIYCGNGGDLKTGLPWQSIHDGSEYQHDPVRLLSVIDAPREAIDRILANHDNVRDLVVNGWIQLVAVDGGKFYRYSAKRCWEQLEIRLSATNRSLPAERTELKTCS